MLDLEFGAFNCSDSCTGQGFGDTYIESLPWGQGDGSVWKVPLLQHEDTSFIRRSPSPPTHRKCCLVCTLAVSLLERWKWANLWGAGQPGQLVANSRPVRDLVHKKQLAAEEQLSLCPPHKCTTTHKNGLKETTLKICFAIYMHAERYNQYSYFMAYCHNIYYRVSKPCFVSLAHLKINILKQLFKIVSQQVMVCGYKD